MESSLPLVFTHNESVMTNYAGEITSPSTHTKIQKEMSFDPDKIFELASVQTSDFDTAVDSAIISSFKDTDHLCLEMYTAF